MYDRNSRKVDFGKFELSRARVLGAVYGEIAYSRLSTYSMLVTSQNWTANTWYLEVTSHVTKCDNLSLQSATAIFITKCDNLLLQNVTAIFITNCDKILLQSATAILLQSATSVL